MANGGVIRIGTAAWSARSLVHEAGWYPRRSMKAAERMAHYGGIFDLVEIDATARFPPTPELARQWVERTPEGFVFDVQAWSLFTGAATMPESLWPDLHDEVRPDARDRRRLYASHLTSDGLDEAWTRFRHALEPLRTAGRLGAVVLRYPPWLRPGSTARAILADAATRLDGVALAAELPNRRWLEDGQRETTLSLLEGLGIAFVCADRASTERVVATTSDLAVVRFHGRHPDYPPAYRYSTEQLVGWLPALEELRATSREVHVVFANCHLDFAVGNAMELSRLLRD